VDNLCCIPLWWDANSTTLRSVQGALRHHYYKHFAHWNGADLLGGHGIKKEDSAAVLVLITMNRLGPPVVRDSSDRCDGLRFDLPMSKMNTILEAMDLIAQPPDAPLHLHSSGFTWPCMDEESNNRSNSNKHGEEEGDDNEEGYYRQAPRKANSRKPEVINREKLLMQCCVEKPIVCWEREFIQQRQKQPNNKPSLQNNNIEELEPYGFIDPVEASRQRRSDRGHYNEMEEESAQVGQGIRFESSILIESAISRERETLTSSSSYSQQQQRSVRDSLIDSRKLESELTEDLQTGFNSALKLMEDEEDGGNFLLTGNLDSASQNDSKTWMSGGTTSKAVLERREADKYSVVLNNTTNSHTNASLWSEDFKEKSKRPLNHHLLAEPPTVYQPGQAMSEYDELDDIIVKSVRPRTMTPKSEGRDKNKLILDTPGQQARFAASKFKTSNYESNAHKKDRSSSLGTMFESPSKLKSGRTLPAPKEKRVSAREAEDSGHRLAYRATAAKWAGPIAGKEIGYGNYAIKSTTRRVVDGPMPTEQQGKWERPSKHDDDDDKDFHAPPPPRARWETKALRLANAYDVPEKPNPYPLFKVGEKVRAQAYDQPHAWFDAEIVSVLPDITGNPAATKYNVRYEGYKQQPSGTSLGKHLPVEMLKGASSMLQVDR
jgi:hypothetical protein